MSNNAFSEVVISVSSTFILSKATEEDLKKVWDTGRIDIELRYGNKLLNWVGIYSREVSLMEPEKDKDEKPITKKEIESAEEGKPASKR